tara:strand:- start:71 stop:208 length:138 start_codon:yes stop_codon:yes gene_type:complete
MMINISSQLITKGFMKFSDCKVEDFTFFGFQLPTIKVRDTLWPDL